MRKKTEPVVKQESDPFNQIIIRPLSTRISAVLAKTPVTPNQVSVFALFLAVLASILIATQSNLFYQILAVLFLYFYLVFDCVDGELARRQNSQSPFGQWLDGIIDTLATSLLLSSLAYAAALEFGVVSWTLGLFAVIGFNVANFSYQYGQLVFPRTKKLIGSNPPALSLKKLFTGFSPSLQMLVIAVGAVYSPIFALGFFSLWAHVLWIGRLFKYHRASRA